MRLSSRLTRLLSANLRPHTYGYGLSHYLPRGPSLDAASRQHWLGQAQSPVTYTGPPRLPFPVLPFQVFALRYEVDIVVETNHPTWRMHEFARLTVGERELWMIKDADGQGVQTVSADLPQITQWFPEIPVPRHATVVDVHDMSTAEVLHLYLTYTNPRGEVTTLACQSPWPPGKTAKRNSSTFNHSQTAVAAILDIPARQTRRVKVSVSYDGQQARIRRILGLVPVQALLEQTQAGFAVASMRLSRGAEQSIVIERPIPGHPWPTTAREEWIIASHRLYHCNLSTIWNYHFEQREMTTATVYQVGDPKALLQIRLSAPLPDLSRPFAGCVKRHFVMEINGQTHGHGWLRAASHGETAVLDIRPTGPRWLATRPMRTRLRFVDGTTVDMTTQRIDARVVTPTVSDHWSILATFTSTATGQ